MTNIMSPDQLHVGHWRLNSWNKLVCSFEPAVYQLANQSSLNLMEGKYCILKVIKIRESPSLVKLQMTNLVKA